MPISKRDTLYDYPKTFRLTFLGDIGRRIASKHKRGGETFCAKFREFLQLLDDSDCGGDYSERENLSHTDWPFCACIQSEVMRVYDAVAEVRN